MVASSIGELQGLRQELSGLSDQVADLSHQLAGLSLELAALRAELAGLAQVLASAAAGSSAPRPAQEPAGRDGSPLASARATALRQRAGALQSQLQAGLNQGLDPTDDAGLDLLIDQMHDLADQL